MKSVQMMRMVLSGSPSVASSRLRGTGPWSVGSGRAPFRVVVGGTPIAPTQHPHGSTTEFTGSVRVVDGDVTSGIRMTGTPPA